MHYPSFYCPLTVTCLLFTQSDGGIGGDARVADVTGDTVSFHTCPEVTVVNSNWSGADSTS